jgi:hypothetical protein
MGGGGNSEQAAAAAAQEQAANPEFTGQMRTFGAGQPDLVQQQLNLAGLGGMIDPSQFNQTTLPIFTNPSEIELYLQSLGKTPANSASSSSASTSSSNNGDYPWYAEPHNIPQG